MRFFGTSYCKSPCVNISGAIKRHVAKQGLQRSLNNKILDYKAMLDFCENKICHSSFLEFVRTAWSMLKTLRNDMKVGTLYMSHGAVTILFHGHPCETVINEQAKMKDESYLDIHDLSVLTLLEIGDINPSTYVPFI